MWQHKIKQFQFFQLHQVHISMRLEVNVVQVGSRFRLFQRKTGLCLRFFHNFQRKENTKENSSIQSVEFFIGVLQIPKWREQASKS